LFLIANSFIQKNLFSYNKNNSQKKTYGGDYNYLPYPSINQFINHPLPANDVLILTDAHIKSIIAAYCANIPINYAKANVKITSGYNYKIASYTNSTDVYIFKIFLQTTYTIDNAHITVAQTNTIYQNEQAHRETINTKVIANMANIANQNIPGPKYINFAEIINLLGLYVIPGSEPPVNLHYTITKINSPAISLHEWMINQTNNVNGVITDNLKFMDVINCGKAMRRIAIELQGMQLLYNNWNFNTIYIINNDPNNLVAVDFTFTVPPRTVIKNCSPFDLPHKFYLERKMLGFYFRSNYHYDNIIWCSMFYYILFKTSPCINIDYQTIVIPPAYIENVWRFATQQSQEQIPENVFIIQGRIEHFEMPRLFEMTRELNPTIPFTRSAINNTETKVITPHLKIPSILVPQDQNNLTHDQNFYNALTRAYYKQYINRDVNGSWIKQLNVNIKMHNFLVDIFPVRYSATTNTISKHLSILESDQNLKRNPNITVRDYITHYQNSIQPVQAYLSAFRHLLSQINLEGLNFSYNILDTHDDTTICLYKYTFRQTDITQLLRHLRNDHVPLPQQNHHPITAAQPTYGLLVYKHVTAPKTGQQILKLSELTDYVFPGSASLIKTNNIINVFTRGEQAHFNPNSFGGESFGFMNFNVGQYVRQDNLTLYTFNDLLPQYYYQFIVNILSVYYNLHMIN
jgi:hypothetical protein